MRQRPVARTPILKLTVIFLLVVVFCAGFKSANAQRVALLPLADISHGTTGYNGINLTITEELGEALVQQGFELVPAAEIERFMIQNRMRYSGYIDSFMARKIGREFDCSHVFVGTVTELRDDKDVALGLTLSAFDAKSGGAVWGSTRGMNAGEFVKMLSIGEPMGLQGLKGFLFDSLLEGVASKIGSPGPTVATASYQLLDLQLSPRYLQGGSPITFSVEFNFMGIPPAGVSLKSGDKLFSLSPGLIPGLYQGNLVSAQENGPHEVSLVFDWGDEAEPETIENLASYEVVNFSPSLDLMVQKGIAIDDVTLFRSHLVIIPELTGRLLMERWTIEIKGGENNKHIVEEHLGNLPERMVWGGKDKFGRKLEDGLYSFSIKAWDAVGNVVEKTLRVVLQTESATPRLEIFYDKGKKYLIIQQDSEVSAPVIAWEITAHTPRTKGILQEAGDSLPAVIEIPENVGEQELFCDLETKDLLGNRLHLKNTKIEIPKEVEVFESDEFASAEEAGWMDSF